MCQAMLTRNSHRFRCKYTRSMYTTVQDFRYARYTAPNTNPPRNSGGGLRCTNGWAGGREMKRAYTRQSKHEMRFARVNR